MKHIISIVTTSLIIWVLVAYCVFLLVQQAIYLSPGFIGQEMVLGIWLIILLSIIRYYAIIGWSRISKPKLTLGILGVILLFVGAYGFVDVAGTNTFLSDATRVVWVYILIAGISWFIWGEGFSGGKKITAGWVVRRAKGAEIIEI